MKRFLVVLVLLAAGAVFAKDTCESLCVEENQECVKSCEDAMKKMKNQKALKYCAPKCAEMKKQCEKDCDDERKGKPLDEF